MCCTHKNGTLNNNLAALLPVLFQHEEHTPGSLEHHFVILNELHRVPRPKGLKIPDLRF
jgi:hypothetical protein